MNSGPTTSHTIHNTESVREEVRPFFNLFFEKNISNSSDAIEEADLSVVLRSAIRIHTKEFMKSLNHRSNANPNSDHCDASHGTEWILDLKILWDVLEL